MKTPLLENFFDKLSKTHSALLLLDYDGTLSPFSPNPQNAHPYPGVCERIKKIIELTPTKVVVISGRSLQELKKILTLDPMPELWGSHGGERLKENSTHPVAIQLNQKTASLLKEAALQARRLAPELYCEVKPFSVALHWRGKDAQRAHELSQEVLTQWEKLIVGVPLEIHQFDGGVELRPKGMNKGEAAKTLLQETAHDVLIAYLGDDATDEEAFEVLGPRALKILVRCEPKPTKADMRLIPPKELLWFFDRWIQSQTKEVT